MKQERLQYLLNQWLNEAGTEAEETELRAIISDGHHEHMVVAVLQEFVGQADTQQNSNDWKRLVSEILEIDKAGSELSVDNNIAPVHRVQKSPAASSASVDSHLFQRGSILKGTWFKYAAAILLLVIGVSLYYIFYTPKSQTEMVQTTPSPVPKILPGSDKAILTLSNGQQVQLNSATSETIKDGTLSIKNNNGQLTYAENGKPHSPFEKGGRSDSQNGGTTGGFNTMQTPKGGQYKLTLSDGTNVWLNAASSITYPTAFVNNTREITISGEAYFEVKKNASKPFIVKTSGEAITVLGTSFNVNAYIDELSVKTSLLEGLVKVGDTFIKPGQAYQDGKVVETNLDQDIAWKNGYFSFKDADIPTVMRQLSRWYNIEVTYRGNIPERRFNGEISRSLTLSEVFKVLSVMRINYTVENKNKIIIHH